MKTLKNKKVSPKRSSVFTQKNYTSNNGFSVYIWGPNMWTILHTISFNYPVEPSVDDKIHYKSFVLSLQNILPCKACRKNLAKNLVKLPLTDVDLENRHSFSTYIYKLHEVVNKMLHKTSGLSYEDVRDRYENFRSLCGKEKGMENGCVKSMYGLKSKCVIQIVPRDTECETFQIDNRCVLQKRDSVA